MLDWYIYTEDSPLSAFEGNDLNQIKRDMVEHYVRIDQMPSLITAINGFQDEELTQQYSAQEISKFQYQIEREVAAILKEAKEECEHQQQVLHERRAQLM